MTATPAGVALANRANATVEQVDRNYFSALGEDRTSFTRMLTRLTEHSWRNRIVSVPH